MERASGRGLLIVAPEEYHEALCDYVQHKQKQLPVRIAGLEAILREHEGADDPERLKRFLYLMWQEQGVQYVLLAGDADVLPVRYMVLDRVTPAAFDYAFYPSDLYYADLARKDGSFEDWNARKDSFHGQYYGEVRGEKNKQDPINFDDVDYLPEIAVGRWPVSTVDEVRIVADKTIRYEKGILEGKRDCSKRVAMLSVSGWVDSRGPLDKAASVLLPDWTVERRYYSDKLKKYDTPEPTAEEVVSLMNRGVGVICHAGHGEDLRWQNSFAVKDLEAVSNADCLPVIFSAGCHTARFATLPPYEPYIDIYGIEHKGTDAGQVFEEPPPPPAPYQKGKYNRPGLGEILLRKGHTGAVAYIGCNTGSQPCGLTLLEGFAAGLRKERLGDCWNHAIIHYHTKERLSALKPTSHWYPPSIFFQGMKFMLFGDPSLMLPSRPQNDRDDGQAN
ncbi:MAG TPA: C25 family cysteine peptidase [Anaerohalosphaeraceae bacterium]|nr:C25 family cysteine peptidase [Anaerohalosphaeraceae bacterium]HRT50960.1 C25 family cysteine peptidase [Anaerohalosphaeraceae bacterium]HRT86946.1 C25 family cysteine peptidase [Anaerohalosphaeraceae bacterium]